jgi:hypothetical protein
MDLETARTVLVASFLAPDSGLLDFDHELVRFLRSKLGKSKLEVLPIVPAPAVPEQTLEDLIANSEFWKHLGREYDADLIVSGAVIYGRQDASGFVDVDRVSEVTGQKVRTTEFVEQEEFSYALDVIFMDGAAGTLRYRDRLQRSAVYRGTQNDPIEAFFQINESLSADLMAIVQPRQRLDPRIVFKNRCDTSRRSERCSRFSCCPAGPPRPSSSARTRSPTRTSSGTSTNRHTSTSTTTPPRSRFSRTSFPSRRAPTWS